MNFGTVKVKTNSQVLQTMHPFILENTCPPPLMSSVALLKEAELENKTGSKKKHYSLLLSSLY